MKDKAFTLIELSIALIIIGLIAGGIIGGASLIQENTIRNIIKDFNTYQSSINLFKNQYGYFPGDFPNAQNYLSTSNGGNGNGYIDTDNEFVYAWQHLALANMIFGNYNGIVGSSPKFIPGTNIPNSKLPSSGYNFENLSVYGSMMTYDITLSQNLGNASNNFNGGVIPSAFAQKLDSKIDDGMPATGIILTIRSASNNASNVCVSANYTSTPGSAVTYLTDIYNNCRILYLYY